MAGFGLVVLCRVVLCCVVLGGREQRAGRKKRVSRSQMNGWLANHGDICSLVGDIRHRRQSNRRQRRHLLTHICGSAAQGSGQDVFFFFFFFFFFLKTYIWKQGSGQGRAYGLGRIESNERVFFLSFFLSGLVLGKEGRKEAWKKPHRFEMGFAGKYFVL